MKFFRKLGFQLVLFFVVAITIPIVMLMVSSITTYFRETIKSSAFPCYFPEEHIAWRSSS